MIFRTAKKKYLIGKYLDIKDKAGHFKEGYRCVDVDENGIYLESKKWLAIFIPFTNIEMIWIRREAIKDDEDN